MRTQLFFRLTLIGGVIMTLLAACAPKPPSLPSQAKPVLSDSAVQYLQEAKTAATPTQAVDKQLLAANSMLTSGDLFGAEQIIKQLKKSKLTPSQKQDLQLLIATATLQAGKPYEALLALGKLKNPTQTLSTTAQKNYRQLKIHAYARNNQLAESLVLQLEEAPSDPSTLTTLWYQLQALPIKTLNQLTARYENNASLSGWFRLSIIAEEYSTQTTQLANALLAWQQQFPTHPGNRFVPTADVLKQVQEAKPPTQIAILLPQSGPLADMGNMITAGMMKAYFSAPIETRVALRFYDSQQGNIKDTYAEAVANGAQIIIGPLTRDNVTAILHHIRVPTIALNYVDTGASQLIQFGLSSTQEARQAAEQSWQYGVNRALIITPNSRWGNQVKNAYITTWQQFPGAIIPAALSFDADNLKRQVAAVLGVEQAYQRADNIKSVVKYADNQYLRFTPRRRQDINGIFLAATPGQAKTINPLLKFYFAGNLPTFASSAIYRPGASRSYNRDLDDLYFCDVPLLLSQAPDMINERKQLQKLWPDAYAQSARLYAIGVDSYHLAINEARVLVLPYFGFAGISGRLYLQANQQIYRQLRWAKMVDGQPKLTQ